MAISFADRVAAAPDVMFRAVGEEAVLLNLNTELYLGLDPVGTRMWNALIASDSIQSAYDSLLSEYEVKPDQLRTDVEELIGKLIEQGLVEVGPAAVAG